VNQEPNPRSLSAGATLLPGAINLDSACDYIQAHAKPISQWRHGLEYELIGFDRQTHTRIDGFIVQALLRRMSVMSGIPHLEGPNIISARMPYGDLTLEPGGQIEFSGYPERTIADVNRSMQRFLSDVREQAEELGIYFIALGFDPLRTLAEQSWIAKRRYSIMRPYLRQRGGHAWDMMTRTAALQVSLDYGDLGDLGRKYVLGNRLGPIVAAMFANSPFADGGTTGLLSTRYAVWLDVDPDRTGPGPTSLDDRFDIQGLAAALLDVPTFYLMRDGELIGCAGQRLSGIEDARVDDFRELLSMIFTEARIREYVEMRSADSGSPQMALALVALWKGLTYDNLALTQALDAVPRMDPAAYRSLQMAVARHALRAHCEGVDVLNLARDIVALAREGLRRIAPDEVHHLDTLSQQVADGVSPADMLLAKSKGDVHKAMQMATVA
jgi:glutamate--cysteine ligase